MRLTPDLIRRSQPYLNPLGQREIGFRNLNISIIENLGIIEDYYECIDFTSNDIVKLEGFPLFTRLDTLLLSNNQISKISPGLHKSLPNITSINLQNNNINDLSDLLPLQDLKKLTHLIIIENPLVNKYKNWQIAVLAIIPQLVYLNCQSISDEIREKAKKFRKALKKGTPLDSLLILSDNTQNTITTKATTTTATAAIKTTPTIITNQNKSTPQIVNDVNTMNDNGEQTTSNSIIGDS